MKRFVLFLMVALLSIGLISATFAANPKIYAKDNVLAVYLTNNATTSSDMTLIVKATGGGTTYFDEGSSIKYLIPTANVAGWTTRAFVDTAWTAAVSGIGYVDGDDNTTIAGPPQTSVFVRYHFDAANAASVKTITLWFDYDDGYVAWLNDVEVGRSDNVKAMAVGAIPDWDAGVKGGVSVDHESTGVAAGKPNATRWDKPVGWGQNQLGKHDVAVDLGDPTSAVSPKAKITSTWGEIKSVR
jgi:hypothetical protein